MLSRAGTEPVAAAGHSPADAQRFRPFVSGTLIRSKKAFNAAMTSLSLCCFDGFGEAGIVVPVETCLGPFVGIVVAFETCWGALAGIV
jgi:hypothetical protein